LLLPRLAWTEIPLSPHYPSSWDYRCVPSACEFFFFFNAHTLLLQPNSNLSALGSRLHDIINWNS
jgi:hypothetical protein